MHLRISTVLSVLLLAISCHQETDLVSGSAEAKSIDISQKELTVKTGQTAHLSAVIRPWNSPEAKLLWESSDEDIATVNEEGMVTAIEVGCAEITVSCSGLSDVCAVTVVSSTIPTESLSIDQQSLSLKNGNTKVLTATLSPENSTETIQWSSSDESIITIDQTGKTTAKSNGIAYITAESGNCSQTIPVVVHGTLRLEQTDALIKPVSFETFSWDPDTVRVARGETATLQFIVYAEESQGHIHPAVDFFAEKGQESGIVITPQMYWLPEIKCSNKWDQWAGGKAPDRYPDNRLYFPDPQMPVDEYPVSLGKGEKMPLWVEFDIPRDIAAGIYEGVVSVTGSDKGEIPFVIQIYDVTLPEKQTMTALQWINYAELDAMAADPGSVHMHANYDRLENIIIPFVSRYGTNGFRTFYSKMWDTGIHFVKNPSGEFEPRGSFSSLQKDIEVMLRGCPDLHYVQSQNLIASVADKSTTGELVIIGYVLNEDGSIKLTDKGNGRYEPETTYVTQGSQHSPEAEAYIGTYCHLLQEFLRSKSLPDGRTWLDIFLQTICDEPVDVTVPAYERISSYVRKGAPELKIMEPLTTGKIGTGYIDIPCPVTSMLDNNPYNIFCDGPFEYGPEQTRWSYTCVQPQGNGLNRFIRIPLYKTRYIHWLNFLYDNTGYLHWGLNYWAGSPDGDPWKDASGSYIGGDMFIIWPGPETVYASIRLSAMRDGLRDYDLLKMVADISETDAKTFCRKVVWNSDQFETDIDKFRSVRKEILEYLSR